ncbi:tetratricopeptide repeat protein [Ramlibacter sp. H39-3-26]|uniref:tetratricopeptide repeat protein n=1 Tax=Curvibacter soli TaxID=3031331 RepID=UPI0023DB4976|nr:tetratricopeptide repeat protein [Ramlibacter sp. H39-3-26]MDF1484272.1 tetratricopeptide repeat protein [Ramlibacter sp. H39-3-26]
MTQSSRFAVFLLAAAAFAAGIPALAQTPTSDAPSAPAPTIAPAIPRSINSTLRDAELFYEVLLGELNAAGSDPGAGFALMLDAARRSSDPELFKRAADIALQSRSGDAALTAARAWKESLPGSQEANRYVLQILVALNRVAESLEPLRTELSLAPEMGRIASMQGIPSLYARVADKALAATIVEDALTAARSDPALASTAWVTIGRMRLAASDHDGTIAAARNAQAADPANEGAAILALELMENRQPNAEAIVLAYLAGKPLPEVRMAYARALLEAQRYSEAARQLQIVTQDKPELAQAWLVQGSLLLQEGQYARAEASLQQYLARLDNPSEGAPTDNARAKTQAYLLLAQIAEKRKDYAAAQSWLDKIDNADDVFSAQVRRASLLAAQGKLDEARKLIQRQPADTPAQQRAKLMAEVELLRNARQFQAAFDLLEQAAKATPDDPDLLYDQAMVAEKLNRLDAMEQLLRRVIAAKPDYHNAYNALGYSLADRGVRLPEAKQLIQKALEYAPGDPFIVDSLAWAEFRMGNNNEALRLLEGAYKSRPDPEIAAHLGEVLWTMGEYHRATAIWKEGMQRGADNETLRETVKRLRARL